MNKIKILENCQDDLEKVGDIAQCAFSDYSADDFKKMSQDKNYKFFVAKIGKEIVGFLIFLNIDEKLEVIKVATANNYKRQGVATELFSKMIDFGVAHQFKGVLLEVNENNLPARKFYETQGFKQIYVRKKYYNYTDDAIILELNF